MNCMQMYVPHLSILGLQVRSWLVFGWGNVFGVMFLIIILAVNRGFDARKVFYLLCGTVAGFCVGAFFLSSIMAVVLGGIAGLFLTKKIIGFHYSLDKTVVLSLALVIAIGRLGCFFNGCCFGSPTTLPWGVTYPLGSPAHWLHHFTYQISPGSLNSLPVHPVQVYESLFLFALIAGIALFEKHFKNRHSVIFLFTAAYFLFRFFIEFIRDMSNVPWSVAAWGPLSVFQWLLLSIGLLSAGCIILLEKKYSKGSAPLEREFPLYKQGLLLAVFYGISMITCQYVLPLLNVMAGISFAGCSMLTLRSLWREHRRTFVPVLRYASGLVLIPLLVPFAEKAFADAQGLTEQPAADSGQAVPGTKESAYELDTEHKKIIRVGDEHVDSLQTSVPLSAPQTDPQNVAHDSSGAVMAIVRPAVRKGLSYYGAFGAGNYSYEVGSCNGPSTFYNDQIFGGVFGGERTWQYNETRIISIGAQASFLQDQWSAYERNNGPDSMAFAGSHPDKIFGASLFMLTDFKWGGAGFGLCMSGGDIRNTDTNGAIRQWMLPGRPVAPVVYLRLGPQFLYGEFGVSDRTMLRPEPNYFHLNLGSRLKTAAISIGVTNLGPNPAWYGDVAFKLFKGLTLQPRIMFSDWKSYSLNLAARRDIGLDK